MIASDNVIQNNTTTANRIVCGGGGGGKRGYLPRAPRNNRGPAVQNCIVLWLNSCMQFKRVFGHRVEVSPHIPQPHFLK